MEKGIKKIIFYSHTPRIFRTTLIGHLYEISQIYPVILLSEELDDEIKEILRNKKLFPKLEKIIPVEQFTGKKMNLFFQNRQLFKLAKNVIQEYKPDIVISPSDTHSLFELYLARFAKEARALVISIQCTLVNEIAQIARLVDLTNAHLKFPSFLPLGFRLFLVKYRKYLGHLLYYWILPLLVAERPFFGKSSYILRKGVSGMRDADYQTVFSKKYYDIFINDGIPVEKLCILSHPLERETKKLFEKISVAKNNYKNIKNTVTLLIPADEIGFKKEDQSLISEEERLKIRMEIVRLVTEVLRDWKVFIKPHPDLKNFSEIKNIFESISDFVEVVNPLEPSDKYVQISNIIIGLPKSISTVLFTASLRYPEKTIISLDFHQELLGDAYKNFDGVEYIKSKEKLCKVLQLIRDNKFHKKSKIQAGSTGVRNNKELSNSLEMIYYLFSRKT